MKKEADVTVVTKESQLHQHKVCINGVCCRDDSNFVLTEAEEVLNHLSNPLFRQDQRGQAGLQIPHMYLEREASIDFQSIKGWYIPGSSDEGISARLSFGLN